ncbi:hypothetical protein [Streptococcus sp. DD12]|uniref:hypothetical protein n=1 Tax=Streptococcus sp. DD12 TaxID=1777880 RepID=UPI000799BBDB|nr:hypothetical protein [Streptococcus sp. DD12]KXT75904.1 hypothetical protein STRDD12_01016 [Streptococcus sp. DD12]
MSDASLRASVQKNEALKSKYQSVQNSIAWNGLSTKRGLASANALVDKCKDYLDKIDGNDGYGYLSNFRDKLSTDYETLKGYRDFVRDSNKAFMAMYEELGNHITALNSAISRDKNAYNKGKKFWERI